jgi:hypothetical protein
MEAEPKVSHFGWVLYQRVNVRFRVGVRVRVKVRVRGVRFTMTIR